jgi:adenylate cyclase class IV
MPPEQPKTRPEDRLARERADIARRVANFRAHQARLEQERDDYYKAVRAKISKTLGASRTTETPK